MKHRGFQKMLSFRFLSVPVQWHPHRTSQPELPDSGSVLPLQIPFSAIARNTCGYKSNWSNLTVSIYFLSIETCAIGARKTRGWSTAPISATVWMITRCPYFCQEIPPRNSSHQLRIFGNYVPQTSSFDKIVADFWSGCYFLFKSNRQSCILSILLHHFLLPVFRVKNSIADFCFYLLYSMPSFIKCFLFYLSLTSAKCPSARSFLDFFLTW